MSSSLNTQSHVIFPEPVTVDVQHVVRWPDLFPLVDAKNSVRVIAIFANAMQFLGVLPVLA
jgi:hypothetical protein